MHDGRPYAIIMQSFMKIRPVVSEEMMSKESRSRGPEEQRKKKKKTRQLQLQATV